MSVPSGSVAKAVTPDDCSDACVLQHGIGACVGIADRADAALVRVEQVDRVRLRRETTIGTRRSHVMLWLWLAS